LHFSRLVCGANRPRSGAGEKYGFTGAEGGSQEARFFDIQITIPANPPIRFRAPVGFTNTMNKSGFGLLGQHGFFDRFPVGFDRACGLLTLDVP
jgi:hypothetical protein